MLPDNTSTLFMSRSGLYEVLERRNKINYFMDKKAKSKLYHANIHKKYRRRDQARNINAGEEEEEISLVNNCSSIMRVQFCMTEGVNADNHLPITPDGRVEGVWEDGNSVNPCMTPCLEEEHEKDVSPLLESYSDVFSEIPGCTSTVAHDIVLTTSERLDIPFV